MIKTKRSLGSRVLSIFFAFIFILTSVFTGFVPFEEEAQAAQDISSSIEILKFTTSRNSALDNWAKRNLWLVKRIKTVIPGVNNNRTVAAVFVGNYVNSPDIIYDGKPNVYSNVAFIPEIFRERATGAYIFCFDRGTPAEGPRFLGDRLPQGYNIANEARLLEIANVARVLFPGGKDASVLLANVDRIFKPAYRAQARASLSGTDGRMTAAVLIQGLIWKVLHNVDICDNYPSTEYRLTTTDVDDDKVGGGGGGVVNKIMVFKGDHICDVIDFNAFWNLGKDLVNREKQQTTLCLDISLEFNKPTTYTGETAEAIRTVQAAGKLPQGITFRDNGTAGVVLTSTLTTAQNFGRITAGGLAKSFSSSVPYDKGGSGQLIVDVSKVKDVCLQVTVQGGYGYIKVESKVDSITRQQIPGIKYGIYRTEADAQANRNRITTITTTAQGNDSNDQNINIIVGNTYFVKELTKAEEPTQKDGLIYDEDIYRVTVGNNATTKNNATPVVFVNTGVHVNVKEFFKFSFDKKDINRKETNLDGVQYKLRVDSLVVDNPVSPMTPIGGYVKNSFRDLTDKVFTVTNGKIEIPQPILPLGRYTLVEFNVPQDSKALLAPTGTELTFENLGDKNDNGNDDELRIISNNTLDKAHAQQNDLIARLGGRPITKPAAVQTNWEEAIKLGLIKITKADKVTKQPLAGFVFEVSGRGIWDGNAWVTSKRYTTEADGSIHTDPMLLGDYTVKEISGTKTYLVPENTINNVTVTSANSRAEAVVTNFENEQQLFDFSFNKKLALNVNSTATVEGAEFEVTVRDLEVEGVIGQKQPGEVVGTFKSDANGVVTVTDLPLGTYVIRETKAPVGTVLNNAEVTVRGRVDGTLNKKSSNVSYDFANAQQLTGEVGALANKLTVVKNSYLPEAEIGSKTFTLEELGLAGNVIEERDFVNRQFVGRIEVNKHMDMQDEEGSGVRPAENGITFKVLDSAGTEVDSFTTNAMGRGGSKYLPIGKYTLSQFNTLMKDGKPVVTKVKDIPFEIKVDQEVIHFTLENAPERMRLRIEKLDKVTGKNILQDNVEFELYNANDELVKFTQYYPEPVEVTRIKMSPKTGFAITLDKLLGGEYYLKEVAGPEGYVFDPEVKIPVTIPSDLMAVAPGETPLLTIQIGSKEEKVVNEAVENTPQYGELVLHKEGEQLVGWKLETVKATVQLEGTTKKETKEVPQVNVALTLISNVLVDGTVEERVETVATDENGKFEREFEAGNYIIKNGEEVLLQKEVTEKEVLSVQLPNKVVEEEIRVDGEFVEKDFTVNKPIYENGYLAGAKFELVAKDDLISYDKQTVFFNKGDKLPIAQQDISVNGEVVYKKGEVITFPKLPEAIMNDKTTVDFTVTTEVDAPVKISRIPLGTVELKEVAAPKGYIKDETVREYEFTPQVRTVLVDLKETERINNIRQKLTITLEKKVVEETEYFGRGGFKGIVFGVYTNAENNGLFKGEPVGIVTPDENGIMTISDIPAGDYYFKELSTKDGYYLDLTEHQVTVDADEVAQVEDKVEIIKKEIVNRPVVNEVDVPFTITKVDKLSGKTLEGVGFKIYAVTNDGIRVPVMNKDSDLWFTDKDGVIKLSNMPMGTYEVEEVEALPTYVNNSTPQRISIAKDSAMAAVIENDPTNVGFRKYNTSTGIAVIGAKLRLEVLKDGEWITVLVNEEGRVVAEDGQPLEWITDGELKNVLGLSRNETYRIVELEAPEGYVLAEPKEFTVGNLAGIQIESFGNDLIPTIKTEAAFETGTKENSLEEEITIVDIVKLTNLVIGKEYEVKGKLVDFEDETKVLSESETVTFVADKKNTEVKVYFKVNSKELAGTTAVVFEDLYHNGRKIASHNEIQDKDQTVYFPGVKTEAKDKNSGNKEVFEYGEATIIDTVKYTNLIPGKEYEVKGILMNKETNSPLLVEGKEVRASKKFIAENAEGTVELEFVFNTKALETTTAVVFEDLYRDGIKIATHSDINDEAQTVKILNPDMNTTAQSEGKKIVNLGEKVTIVDKIDYRDYLPGKYRFTGTLMVKETGEPLVINGKVVTAETVVDITERSGTVEVVFKDIDTTTLSGKTLVVFEESKVINEDGSEVLIDEHKDINDKDQTVEVAVLIEFRLVKVDSKNNKLFLAGAEFTVYNLDGTVAKDIFGNDAIGVTDRDGIVRFKLQDGDYYAMETKAPAGYQKTNEKIEIKAGEKAENGVINLEVFVPNEAIIIPKPPVDTAVTSSLGVSVIGMALASLGLILSKKKKETEEI